MAGHGLSLSSRLRGTGRHKHRRQEHGLQAPKPFTLGMVSGLQLPLDVAVLTASAAIAYAIWLVGDPYVRWQDYALLTGAGMLLAINAFFLSGLYRPDMIQRPGTSLRRTIACWLGVSAVLIAAGFVTKTSENYSRLWALSWFGLGLALLVVERALFFVQTARLATQGKLHRTVAIVGRGPLPERLAAHFAANPAHGIKVEGTFTDENRPVTGDVDGNLLDLVAAVRRGVIDTVIVAVPKFSERRLRHIVDLLADLPVDIRLCPGSVPIQFMQAPVSHYAGIPMFHVMDRPLANWRYAAKEAEDRFLALCILLMISPILLTVAAAIKLDSRGPIFFRQKRHGYNNQLIEVFKFRTMYSDMTDANASQLTQKDDPRITPIGKILRKYSLDELPQFINVLRGEMSIVGPRPHAISAKAAGMLYRDAVAHYASRHRVKPGITGWAQINGWRGPTDTVRQIQKRVEYDLYYIDNWSLWLDLKIILLTPFKGVTGQNAF